MSASRLGAISSAPAVTTRCATSRPALRWLAWIQVHGWITRWLLAALVLAELPLVWSTFWAPSGHTGLGTVWFANDFSQYGSAMLQGASQPGWLIHDPFTAEPQSAALMFPLYVGIGKLAANLHMAPMALERLLELLARALFVVSLWRFVQRFAISQGAARAAYLLALFGGGLGLFAAAISQVLGPGSVYGGSFSYETTTLGLLFSAPHVPLALAATLELAGWLKPRQRIRSREVIVCVLLGAGIALLHPFHLPVLLAALGLCGLAWWLTGAGRGTLLAAIAATVGALPVLLPTVQLFTFDAFWSATYTQQNLLPSPAPHELFVDMGATLVLALIGVWFWRGRVAPFGLAVWLLLALVAMYLPVPYQRRLAFGAAPAVAVLAGNALILGCAALSARRAVWLRLGVVFFAASGTLLILLSAALSLATNGPLPVYRSTPDLDAAAVWLASNATENDLVAADWDTSNFLVGRAPVRVIGGHPVATLDPAQKKFLEATLFAHGGDLQLAHLLGAQWMIYGPLEASVPRPRAVPAFTSGDVAVYRVP